MVVPVINMKKVKRSDAVLIIEQCLIEPHFPEDSSKQAEVILKKLEKLGMLPPNENFCPVLLTKTHYWHLEER